MSRGIYLKETLSKNFTKKHRIKLKMTNEDNTFGTNELGAPQVVAGSLCLFK